MKKNEFYKIQAEAFWDYEKRFSYRNFNKHNIKDPVKFLHGNKSELERGNFKDYDRIKLFNQWATSKDITGADRQEIWKIVRTTKKQDYVITEGSEEFIRLSEVISILHNENMKQLGDMLSKKKCG